MRRGMTQAQLAERAGVSRQWIVQFEKGKTHAELIAFLRVLEALEVELTAASPRDVRADAAPARRPEVPDLDDLLWEHVQGETGP